MIYTSPGLDTSPFELARGHLIAPKPKNDADLAILTEIYFGATLSLSILTGGGGSASYKVTQPYNSYHGDGFKYGKCCTVGYDHSAFFWRHVIGDLRCGGVAGRSYGQAKIVGHREKNRISNWILDRRKDRGSPPDTCLCPVSPPLWGGREHRGQE